MFNHHAPISSRRARALALALVLCPGLAACVAEEELGPEDLRSVVFDGEEVQAALAEDPDAVFFVDLREPSTYRFDQRVEPLAFEHFMVQCPSMPAPIPMEQFAAILELNTAATLWTVEPAGEGFRDNEDPYQPDQGELDCGTQCDANGGDCVIVCTNGG